MAAAGAYDKFRSEAKKYVAPQELKSVLRVARMLDLPLLLTGEPGCGKTTAAYWAALAGLNEVDGVVGVASHEVVHFQVRSSSTSQELRYEYDHVQRFHDANSKCVKQPLDYIRRGKLWEALDRENQVLLIDEIDKAPRDFPNDLLLELDQLGFEVPEMRGVASSPDESEVYWMPQKKLNRKPFIVVTSNGDRDLPRPFLRRCVCFEIVLTETQKQEIVAKQFPTSDANAKLLEKAIKIVESEPGRLLRSVTLSSRLLWMRMLLAEVAAGRAPDGLGTDKGMLALLRG